MTAVPDHLSEDGAEAQRRVVVRAAAPEHLDAARAVAAVLGLPAELPPGAGPAAVAAVAGTLVLRLDAGGWTLLDPARGGAGSVRCDLLAGGLGERLRQSIEGRGASGEGRLARALGLRRHPAPSVLDATAGLGRDTLVAAALGCAVVACERSPIVALLLRDGLARATADATLAPIVARVRVEVADARAVLAALPDAERPDVVLLDPMFPERRKSARAKGEMQLLQLLLGATPEEDAPLLAAALAEARRRVVVKRPAHAPPIAGARSPDLAVAGRAARYDVYVIT